MVLAVRTSPGTSHQLPIHPMADYRRLACPSCGKSYKYRGGLLRHIGECFTDDPIGTVGGAVGTSTTSTATSPAPKSPVSTSLSQIQSQITPKDVRVLSKFWKNS